MRDARPVALSLAVILGLAFGAGPAEAKEETGNMIRAINAFRASHGVKPLRTSRRLGRSAESYSQWMADTGFFRHRARRFYEAAARRYGCFGEVLARTTGRRAAVRETVRGWIRSPMHRSVILDPDFGWAGAGRATGLFGGARTLWTVQVGCSVRG